MNKKKVVLASLVLIAAGAGALAWYATQAKGTAQTEGPKSTYTLAEAETFSAFALYDAGSEVAGYALTAVLRDTHPVEYISFLHGDCIPSADTGCPLPVAVQVWPACFRNLSLYQKPTSPSFEKLQVRGVPAAFFEGDSRLEMQTGTSTVVIFASGKSEAIEVANALRGVNVAVGAEQPLPAPAEGSLTGALRCE